MFIKNNLSWINIEIACECLGLSRSSYYEWVNNESQRTLRTQKKQAIINVIRNKYEQSKKRYGSTKITESIKKDNLIINKKTVAKIMREKITNNEIEEYKSLKVVYDKLKGTV